MIGRSRHFSKGVILMGGLLTLGLVAGNAVAQSKDSVVVTGEAAKRSLTKGEISGDTAERISRACQDYAKQHNFAAIVFILDPYGNIVHSHRMDGVRPVQFQSAMDKAKTSLFMRVSTSILAARVGNNETAQVRYRIRPGLGRRRRAYHC